MSDKPASATSDLQARLFDLARRRVVLADLTGRDWLFNALIVTRSVVLCLDYRTEIWIMISGIL
jgi:hypothetical protein